MTADKSKTTRGERRDIQVGDIALVQSRPNYWATVTYASDHPGGKVTVDPHPGQGVTERKRTVWKDKVIEWAGSRPVTVKEPDHAD